MIKCPTCKRIFACKVEITLKQCDLCRAPHLQFVKLIPNILIPFDNAQIIYPPYYHIQLTNEPLPYTYQDVVSESIEIIKRNFKVNQRAIDTCIVITIEPNKGIYRGYIHTIWWNELEEV